MATITIGRITYEVERRERDDSRLPGEPGRPGYWLRGPRGALYYTMRNQPNPDLMFLVNGKGFTRNAPEAWLTDRNGTLELRDGRTR
jgi:hypothetical protein